MSLIQQFTSILLAILMANPGCCCTLKKIFSSSESQPIHSCCSTPTPSDDSEPSDCPNCPCEKMVASHDVETPFSFHHTIELNLEAPDPEHLVVHFPKELPRQNSPPHFFPPPLDRFALLSRFLI